MVTPEMILARLPAYKDEWVLVTDKQYVPDIIKEVCKAHKEFALFYDQFSDLFYSPDPETIADNIYNFCSSYLRYKEEPVKNQTSALPTGIIHRGYVTGQGVDCKHYALFSAGVISSINRLYGCCLVANFLFVGYGKAKEPYHVFVSLEGDENDIWIDPTPGSGGQPTLVVSKKV